MSYHRNYSLENDFQMLEIPTVPFLRKVPAFSPVHRQVSLPQNTVLAVCQPVFVPFVRELFHPPELITVSVLPIHLKCVLSINVAISFVSNGKRESNAGAVITNVPLFGKRNLTPSVAVYSSPQSVGIASSRPRVLSFRSWHKTDKFRNRLLFYCRYRI